MDDFDDDAWYAYSEESDNEVSEKISSTQDSNANKSPNKELMREKLSSLLIKRDQLKRRHTIDISQLPIDSNKKINIDELKKVAKQIKVSSKLKKLLELRSVKEKFNGNQLQTTSSINAANPKNNSLIEKVNKNMEFSITSETEVFYVSKSNKII